MIRPGALIAIRAAATVPTLPKGTLNADFKPKSHRGDFTNIHPIEAAGSPQSCNRCHDAAYLQYLPQPLSNGLIADQVPHDAGPKMPPEVSRCNRRTFNRGQEKSAVLPELPSRRGRLHTVPQQRQGKTSPQKLEVREFQRQDQ